MTSGLIISRALSEAHQSHQYTTLPGSPIRTAEIHGAGGVGGTCSRGRTHPLLGVAAGLTVLALALLLSAVAVGG